MRRTKFISAILLSTMLTACSLAPTYKKPDVTIPDSFKEAHTLEGNWQLASGNAGQADASPWWTIFKDEELNALEQAALKENNSLKAAAARLDQARALQRQTVAGFYPEVGLAGNAARSDMGRDQKPSSSFLVGGMVSYDAQMLVRIKDEAAAAKAGTREAEALYRQALLMVQADVADNYFALLGLDTERDLLRKTIELRIESQKLIERRFKEGEAGEQDFLRAKAETAATQADLKALDQQRAIREHALAILTGVAPAQFAFQDKVLPKRLPRIPAGLPSSLLERRPDVAAAQERLIQTNARIGLARSAFFPNISLTALGGLASSDLGDLFSWSSRAWTLGPLFGTSVSLPIFDAGKRLAGVDAAKAQYAEAVGNYRQQVLVAFKDVEDSLSSLNLQAQQADHLYQAAEAATKASRISDLRYKEGETSYLEALDTQRDTLSVQRSYTQVQAARFNTTVNLIRALGGGWIEAQKTEQEAVPKAPQETPVPSAVPSEAKQEATSPKAEQEPTPLVKPADKPVEKTVESKPVAEEKPAAAPVVASAPAPVQAPRPVPVDDARQQLAPATPQPDDGTDAINTNILFDQR